MNNEESHNPYFNRWFSAIVFHALFVCITEKVTILILIDGFLQYVLEKHYGFYEPSHNPYFNRWFSAIWITFN
mgnify:CR=1 FL=1